VKVVNVKVVKVVTVVESCESWECVVWFSVYYTARAGYNGIEGLLKGCLHNRCYNKQPGGLMVRCLLDKPICPAQLALGDEVGDLGSSPSWAIIFLLLFCCPAHSPRPIQEVTMY